MMKRSYLGAVGLILLGAGPFFGLGINDPVIEIIVMLGKVPGGSFTRATSDGSGTVRLPIAEPGRYVVEFTRPRGSAVPVALRGEIRRTAGPLRPGLPNARLVGTPVASGAMVTAATAADAQVSIAAIPFGPASHTHREEITVTQPVELILRFTEAPPQPCPPGQRPPCAPLGAPIATGFDRGSAPPWQTNQWPWQGQWSGTPMPGAQIGIMDDTGRIVTSAAIQRDGAFSVPEPRVAFRGAPRVCIMVGPGAQPVCGEPGNPAPELSGTWAGKAVSR